MFYSCRKENAPRPFLCVVFYYDWCVCVFAGISNAEARQPGKAPNFSVNWMVGDQALEVINATTGKDDMGRPSRLCKHALYSHWVRLHSKVPLSHIHFQHYCKTVLKYRCVCVRVRACVRACVRIMSIKFSKKSKTFAHIINAKHMYITPPHSITNLLNWTMFRTEYESRIWV